MATQDQISEALRGLQITRADGLVLVAEPDGADVWLTTADAWQASREALDDGTDDDDAYTTLATGCTPCLSLHDSRGPLAEQRKIVATALAADLIDLDRAREYEDSVGRDLLPARLMQSGDATEIGDATDAQIAASLATEDGQIMIDEGGDVVPPSMRSNHGGPLRPVYCAY